MSIKKKIVWLPYDFDTAIGINNEGELVFGYELEDTDHLSGGADVYNGQNSVIWNNIRLAFAEELKSMYQQLRSQGKLSYEAIEKAFEEHQSKWPEALFNEDSQFCYLDPLINSGTNYLEMLQGSKEEQRKWWLYNRFRYIDSKYNAGDALSDLIQLRSYAKSDITITPYADIYPAVKFGSYLVTKRGQRNVATLLECPVDALNDTETYIYSASQLASVGDLSGLKVGFADFSMATKLQSLKLGDASSSYENQNLKVLTLGNNVLLQTIDVRNCTALGSGDMKVVDISGCTGIQKAWFDNTKITALTLPIGGVLDTLSLPATITNLTIRNQPKLTSFTLAGNNYGNISTCRIENTDYFLKNQTRLTTLLNGLPDKSRLRLVGLDIDWLADTTAINTWYDSLDRFRGLDINGENLDDAYVEGVIHIDSAKGSDIAALLARYPYMRIDATHTESYIYYYNGSTLITSEKVLDGGNGSYTGTTPTKANSDDGHYSYTFAGWSKDDDNTVDSDALTAIIADRNVYACFDAVVRTYTVTWVNNGTTIETDNNVAWGTTPHYDGSTPTKDGQTSTGWLPDPTQPITGNTTFTAQYLPVYTVTFKNDTGSTTLDTQRVVQGQNATYGGATPTSSEDASLAWLGWATSANSHTANAVLTNIQSNMTVYAAFASAVEVVEIEDDWATILSGTKEYKLGNYKPLDLGAQGVINMQIVGINTDTKASGGFAKYTWLSMTQLSSTHVMNSAQKTVDGETAYTAGGWEHSDMRSYLKDTIKPLIPEIVRNAIVPVTKIQSIYTGGAKVIDGQTTTDDVWIPSNHEVFSTNTSYESQGANYGIVFKTNADRIRTRGGSANRWWLRSALSGTNFRYVNNNGSDSNINASYSYGVVLGFCTD